ncbi:MAG TPA: STAS domain-containing protein [Verrucomicrobiae bacterium]
MNQSLAKLMVAVCDRVVFIKVIGRADFNLSVDLKKLFSELWAHGFRRFVLETGQCQMMDSTFFGTLSDFALKSSAAGGPQAFPLEIINPGARIIETMETLGIAHLFKITLCPDVPAVDFQPHQAGDKSKAEVARNCWEAHMTLMGLKAENIERFKDVAQFMAEDLKRLESAEQKKPGPARE